MSNLLAPVMPALGVNFVQEDGFFVAATTTFVARGQILEVDEAGADPGSTTGNVGATTDRLARAREIDNGSNAYLGGRTLIVALQPCAMGQKFRARIRGVVDMALFGVYHAGDVIIQNSSFVAGARIFGQVLEGGGTLDTATFGKVLWDGERGFATLVGATPPGGDPVFPTDDSLPIYDPHPPPGGGPNPGEIGNIGSNGIGIVVVIR